MTTVLGIGGSIHDFASCVVQDARIVAIEDERLTRVRYALGAKDPCRVSAERCLGALGRRITDLDAVLGNDELLQVLSADSFANAEFLNHHYTHAASALFTSPFEEAAILVVDGAGSRVSSVPACHTRETTTYAFGKGNRIEVLDRVVGDMGGHNPKSGKETLTSNSIGEMYRAVAEALGLEPLTGPGKAMGLASYGSVRGDERFVEEIFSFVDLLPEGQFRIRLNGPDGLIERCWQLRRDMAPGEDPFPFLAALAHAGQVVLEELLLHAVEYLARRVESRNLCLVGGVALNSLANGRLARETAFEQFHVLFAPGDSGTALGATLAALVERRRDRTRLVRFQITPYLGPVYPMDGVVEALAAAGVPSWLSEDPGHETAGLLERGKIVAWFQGGSEFGPRALGNRSLLADPRTVSVREHLNDAIKRREWYRPFAPCVLEAEAGEYFDLPFTSPWMQYVWPVREHARALLPGVTHVDGGARVQTVSREDNARFHCLLESFHDRTGVPVLLNTSLNVRGQPIVETPEDALETFLETPIDALVIGDLLAVKP